MAQSSEEALAAVKKIKVEIDPLHVITDPREAKEKGELIIPPRHFKLGDVESAWSKCDYIFESIHCDLLAIQNKYNGFICNEGAKRM